MKFINKFCIFFIVLSTGYLPIFAQHHPSQKTSGYVKSLLGKTDSVETYKHLLDNAPSEFGSHVPKFAVIGREKIFYLGIGGCVKTTVSYDFGHVIDNPNEFLTSAIPTTNQKPGNGGLTQFSAQQTCLFVNFVGLPGSDNEIGAFVNFNLLGNNYAPVLQYAYIKYRGIKAGYDKTLFSDPAATPPTIDYEGPNSSTAISNAIVNYSISFGKNKSFSAGIGAELPVTSVTASESAYQVNQRIPDIPVFFQWAWDNNSSWIRMSAVLRNMQYRDMKSDKNIDKVGWGVQLSGSATIIPNLVAYYQGVYGRGIASYLQDMTGTGMDLVPSSQYTGVLNPVKTWGAYAGLQYNICPKVFISATYSQIRNYIDKKTEMPSGESQYRYSQYIVANAFWDINSILQAGVEYIYGRRINFNQTQAHDSRIQASLQINF